MKKIFFIILLLATYGLCFGDWFGNYISNKCSGTFHKYTLENCEAKGGKLEYPYYGDERCFGNSGEILDYTTLSPDQQQNLRSCEAKAKIEPAKKIFFMQFPFLIILITNFLILGYLNKFNQDNNSYKIITKNFKIFLIIQYVLTLLFIILYFNHF